jgi:hypothetical protein
MGGMDELANIRARLAEHTQKAQREPEVEKSLEQKKQEIDLGPTLGLPKKKEEGLGAFERPADREADREPVREVKLKPGQYLGRNGEILQFNGYGTDKFHIPANEMDPDWAYQWCTESILGDRTHANLDEMHANGWRPVPQERHPLVKVLQSGNILMERPMAMQKAAIARDQRAAKEQRDRQDNMLGINTPSGFDNTPGYNKVSRQLEPMPADIRQRDKYELAH